MNKVRKRITKQVAASPYTDFWMHKDLIAFCVCDNYFCWNPLKNIEEESDFNEVIIITEKEWLFSLIKLEQKLCSDEEARKFLIEAYTSEDSFVWYEKALEENKIVTVKFN